MKKALVLAMIAVALVSTAGCRSFVLKTVMGTVDPYFHGSGIDGTSLDKAS